jgi:hypothetical protein
MSSERGISNPILTVTSFPVSPGLITYQLMRLRDLDLVRVRSLQLIQNPPVIRSPVRPLKVINTHGQPVRVLISIYSAGGHSVLVYFMTRPVMSLITQIP